MTNHTNPPPAPAHSTAPTTPAKTAAAVALGWLHTARFLTTAPQLHFLPSLEVPEIAFVGRSNAGKSTCINTLTQQKQLAFASKKPGFAAARPEPHDRKSIEDRGSRYSVAHSTR